jgi:pyruvate dehydrogenase E2 component (dihydrolipoamide acetyltransferase)
MSIEIKVPDLGENVESGRVVAVLISVGESIEIDQPILELETDKAVLEVPSSAAGKVTEIKVAEGDDIASGNVCLVIEAEAESGASEAEESSGLADDEPNKTVENPAEPPQTAVTQPEIAMEKQETITQLPLPKRDITQMAPAAPSVRKFSREIGVNIHAVSGSGPSGRISIEDVKRYSKQLNEQRHDAKTIFSGMPAEALPDFSQWGAVDTEKMSKLRETAAKHLSYAWAAIPHVTQFDKADITELERMRKKYAKKAETAGGKLTVTAILLKIIEKALKKFPIFNSSVDMEKKEVILKRYYNIGVAADTPAGLMVPVVKNVDQKNIFSLAAELSELSAKARDRKLSLEEMQGGNFSISNLGGIGGIGFTPVVNSPEVAILGVSRAEMQPVYENGEFLPKLVMPLALSYDHRVIDGADAARFLRWVCQALEEPFFLLLDE